jgi:uncharacterized protein
MRLGALGGLMLGGLLTACGSSPPSHYYQLTAGPDPPITEHAGYAMRTVALGEVKLPGALDRPQIARQIGPNQIEYAETERWAGPLDEMSRSVLAADLRSRLPAGTTLIDSDSLSPANSTIAVEVSRFSADNTGRVTLDATWQALDKSGRLIGVPRAVNIVEPAVGSDAAAVAAAMSRAMVVLAGNISSGIVGESATALR